MDYNNQKRIRFCSHIENKENDSTEFFNLVLFDLDGTIIDSGRGIYMALEYAFEKLGEEIPDSETLRKFIGPPLIWSFQNICGYDEEKAMEGVRYYREFYPKKGIFENDVIKGVPELVKYIKSEGASLYVATSKPEVFAAAIMDNIGLANYFDGIIGSSMDNSKEDKASVVKKALTLGEELIRAKLLDSECNNQVIVNALMIGDRSYDIIGAHKNNIKCLAVNNGYGSFEEYVEAGADYIFDSMEDKRWFCSDAARQ